MTELSAYADLSARVAGVADDGSAVLTLPCFPDPLDERTDVSSLVIFRPTRRSIGWTDGQNPPFEVVDHSLGHDWYAEAETFRLIGLWMLHLVLSGRDYAGLTLSHPESRVATLWVQLARPELDQSGGLSADGPLNFSQFEYIPAPVQRHPFGMAAAGLPDRAAEVDRPMFRFGWSDSNARLNAHPEDADEIILTITPTGLAAMAELFFDFAAPRNDVVELNMEPPFVGMGGTMPYSLEARFWLPGSFAFFADTLDQMSFEGMGA